MASNLSRMLDLYFRVYEIEQNKLAREIGVSESTLSRTRSGKMPDAAGFSKLMLWLASEAKPSK